MSVIQHSLNELEKKNYRKMSLVKVSESILTFYRPHRVSGHVTVRNCKGKPREEPVSGAHCWSGIFASSIFLTL